MHIPILSRISTKITLASALLLFATILLVVVGLLRGFAQTRTDVTTASQHGLQNQGQVALFDLTQVEAKLLNANLEQAASTTRHLVSLFNSLDQVPSLSLDDPLSQLTTGPANNRFDANPNRKSDLVIFANTPDSALLRQNLRDSQILDAIFPGVLANLGDALAIYYVSNEGMTRYYPVSNLQDIVPPDFDVPNENFYTIVAATRNPERKTVWTDIYSDELGKGLLTTVSSPIYQGDQFRGFIGIDITLNEFLKQLDTIKPTPSSYAFVLDQQGDVIAAPQIALQTFLNIPSSQTLSPSQTLELQMNPTTAPALASVLERMQNNQSGIQTLQANNQDLVVANAALTSINWHIVVVAPKTEITSEAQAVTATIETSSGRIVGKLLWFLAALTIITLLATWLISNRLSQPIVALVQNTQALAESNQFVQLPEQSNDELGFLARAFNQMASKVQSAQQSLQQVNQNLEQTVQQRTHELEQERESLQQTLDQLKLANNTVAKLTAPIIPVAQGVVVVPITGSLNTERIEQLQQAMLRTAERLRIHTIILDVTGLEVLEDSATFVRSLDALRLLGSKAMLVGVSADFAQDLIQSGINLDSVTTMANLQAAVRATLNQA